MFLNREENYGMCHFKNLFILILGAFVLFGCSLTNKVGHMMVNATEHEKKVDQTKTTKEKNKGNFK
jgi:outer membrane murein-binding lipoprotein Lpp